MNRLKHLQADALRQAQTLGLLRAGQVAAKALKEPYPIAGDIQPWQIRTLEAMQGRICEPDNASLPTPDECGALEATLRFVRSMPTSTVERMAALLSLFEAAPLVLGPNRTRFSLLPPAEQTAFLSRWPDSRIPAQRAAFHAIKTICMMGYWSRESTWSAIGYSIGKNPGVPERLRSAP